MKFSDYSLADAPVITTDIVQKKLPELTCISVVLRPECFRQVEQASGVQPFGKHVSGCVAHQHIIRDVIDDLLQLGKARGPSAFIAARIPEHEVSETELLLHVILKLQEKRA